MPYYRWGDIKHKALSSEQIAQIAKAVRREVDRLRVRVALRRAGIRRRLARWVLGES